MLVSTLRTHPDVICYGELFRKNKKRLKGSIKIISELDSHFQDEKIQQDRWRDFLDAVAVASENFEFVGFKLMVNQNSDVRRGLIDDPGYKKILLKRENGLAVYSSDKIARVTGQGSAGRFAKVKTAKVEFIPTDFESYLEKYEKRYITAEKELKESGCKYLRITYAALCRPDGIRKVLSFIGANRSLSWKTPTKKRNTSTILDRFTNKEQVSEYLLSTGRQNWSVEKI